jgi:hypothetical protein
MTSIMHLAMFGVRQHQRRSILQDNLRRAYRPRGVSQVVEDAMVVVKALGKRYLWVDQWCIEQNNGNVKHLQIQEMDRMYAGAYATIVASAGSNSTFGLPGISRSRRSEQLSATVSDMELYSSLPPLQIALNAATWNERGWTYQETILSRRCLFFTDIQVYFVCAGMSSCEAAILNQIASPPTSTLHHSTESAMSAVIFRDGNFTLGEPPFDQFAAHICQFSGRHLTYDNDILNAFRGLLT